MDVIIMHLKYFYLRNRLIIFVLIGKGKQIWEDRHFTIIEGDIYLTRYRDLQCRCLCLNQSLYTLEEISGKKYAHVEWNSPRPGVGAYICQRCPPGAPVLWLLEQPREVSSDASRTIDWKRPLGVIWSNLLVKAPPSETRLLRASSSQFLHSYRDVFEDVAKARCNAPYCELQQSLKEAACQRREIQISVVTKPRWPCELNQFIEYKELAFSQVNRCYGVSVSAERCTSPCLASYLPICVDFSNTLKASPVARGVYCLCNRIVPRL